MKTILPLILTLHLFTAVTHAQQTNIMQSEEPHIVADQYYWSGSEGNVGISFTGKFQSLEKMAKTFNLLQEIGEFKTSAVSAQTMSWKLHHILISIDLNANGNVAKWQVSGPKPLLFQYLEKMKRDFENRSLFYDFGYTIVNFKPTAYWEREN
jgi:hypothetical protein